MNENKDSKDLKPKNFDEVTKHVCCLDEGLLKYTLNTYPT